MDIERRQTPRHVFGGVVEISSLHPNVYFVAQTTEISLFGCFVRTSQVLPVGTEVNLKISYRGTEFNASGKVVYAMPGKGVGIGFTADTEADTALLGKWLRETGTE